MCRLNNIHLFFSLFFPAHCFLLHFAQYILQLNLYIYVCVYIVSHALVFYVPFSYFPASSPLFLTPVTMLHYLNCSKINMHNTMCDYCPQNTLWSHVRILECLSLAGETATVSVLATPCLFPAIWDTAWRGRQS